MHAELEWSDAARAEAERRAAALQGECEALQRRVEGMRVEVERQEEVGLLAQEEVRRRWDLTLTLTLTLILTLILTLTLVLTLTLALALTLPPTRPGVAPPRAAVRCAVRQP